MLDQLSNWGRYPTKNILMRAQLSAESRNFLVRNIDTRGLVIASVAVATIEALGRTVTALSLIGVFALQNLVCMTLRVTFLITWGAIGYLSSMALDKSIIRWVQFVALQIMLGYANPGNWLAQWKLWGRIMQGMGDFANNAAYEADRIERLCHGFASWSHSKDQVNRAASLLYFSVSSSWRILSPDKIFKNYSRSVEELPDRRPVHQKIAGCVKEHWGLIATTGIIAGAAYAHLNCEGYKERMDYTRLAGTQIWHLGGILTHTGISLTHSIGQATVGRVANYFRNYPNYILQNQVNDEKLKYYKGQNQSFCPQDVCCPIE